MNPKHLRLGTADDNAKDKVLRSRKHGNSKRIVSIEDVKKIKKLWDSGEYLQEELSEMFGISRTTINAIIRGKAWWYSECLKEKK